LVKQITTLLRPGGIFILDVETPNYFKESREKNTWFSQDTGFFMNEPHVCLESRLHYPNHLYLDRYILIPSSGVPRVIQNWHQAFTPESLAAEITAQGLQLQSWYSDVSGAPYTEDCPILCGVFQKPS
jgi:hypothetical protein